MLLIFSMEVLIRYQWQLKTVVFLHGCVMHALLLISIMDHSEIDNFCPTMEQHIFEFLIY